MQHPRDAKFDAVAAHMGYNFEEEIKIGGNYTSVAADRKLTH